jgi:1-acyl-sn-glycerol-3-phosphate acyltransferase
MTNLRRDPDFFQPIWRILLLQSISYLLARTYFIISGSKIYRDKWHFDQGVRYIVAANHISLFDPFVCTSALGWATARGLMPCRFMTTPKFLSIRYLGRLMIWLGSFPSHPFGGMPYGIDGGERVLKNDQTLVIFPQGKRHKCSGDPGDARPGVILIGQKFDESMIIPVLMELQRRKFWFNKFSVYCGKPLNPHEYSAESLMKHIFSLNHSI